MKKKCLVIFFLLFGQTAYAAECYVKSLGVLFPAACGVKCMDEQIYP